MLFLLFRIELTRYDGSGDDMTTDCVIRDLNRFAAE